MTGVALSQEKFDYLRTQLLRMIGHEVRSPAGVAWTALAELEGSVTSDTAQKAMVLLARRSVRRLLHVADRISMAAELEQGPLALQLAPVVLGELVVRMRDAASELGARKGVVLETEPAEPNQASIEADARWLGPVIMELIVNALRHARARVRVRTTVDGARATILVATAADFRMDSCSAVARDFFPRA